MHALIIIATLFLGSIASAQTLSPMEARVVSFSERAALRARVGNPYAYPRRFDLQAYDLEWTPVEDVRFPRNRFVLAPGAVTSVLAIVPADWDRRSIYFCATAEPDRARGGSMRGRVCGRYVIERRSL